MKNLAPFLFVALLGCGGGDPPAREPRVHPLAQAMVDGTNPEREELIALVIGGATYEVEVAGDAYGTQLGLMYRRNLRENEGMWFEFPDQDFLRFWMKNTPSPLSIAYVDSKGVIANIEDMVPFDESTVPSKRKVKYAWEMPRGWFKQKGIKAGDTIRIGKKKINPKYKPPE
ncbi:MAG: DUF192 domain-containing protein [Candidatus Omnitrophica bacterium]|nr:hypothetical protein [bacterium]NUN94620.1 DUF192 domain-containing protein [Candidatus Omnitrophota bacterium]